MEGDKVSEPAWSAILDWLPGAVAGGLPMMVFLMANALNGKPGTVGAEHHHFHFYESLVAHMLILGIANSSVSVMTAFTQVFAGRLPSILRDGRGPSILVFISVVTLVYQTSLYAWLESGAMGLPLAIMAGLGLLGSLVVSLYLSFALGRLYQLAAIRKKMKADRKRHVAIRPLHDHPGEG